MTKKKLMLGLIYLLLGSFVLQFNNCSRSTFNATGEDVNFLQDTDPELAKDFFQNHHDDEE